MNRRLNVPVFLSLGLVLLAAASSVVLAQQERSRVVLEGDADGASLTLAEALRVALENNLELEAARVAPELANEKIVAEEGGFDGTLSAELSYNDYHEPQTITVLSCDPLEPSCNPGASTDGLIDSADWNGFVGWTDPLKFGGSYTVEFRPRSFDSISRTISQEGFFRDSIREGYERPLTLRFDLPLLRGFGTRVNTETLVLARTDAEKSVETYRGEAIRVIELAEGAYWDVVARRAELRTARIAFKRAEDLLALNKKKVDVGTLAPIEITQAEAEVASKTEGVIVAEVNLRNAEDELRKIMSFPADDPVWAQALVTTDRPSFLEQEIDVGAAIETALANRPEVINAQHDLAKTDLSTDVARKNAWHQLDLSASYSPGVNDSDQGFVFPTGQSVDSLTSTDSDTRNWRVGLLYSVPVQNRTAKANKRIALLNRSKAELDLQTLAQSIRVEVRTAVRNVESGFKRVEAARKNVELQNEKLDAEQKKFDNGMSTSFEVLTFQNDLADAELRLISAGLDYVKSVTAVERAKGTLLDARGLIIE